MSGPRQLRVRCGAAEDADSQVVLPTGEVLDFVDRLCTDAGLDREKTYWMRLAADEISTNIAHHGYHDREGILEVTGWVDDAEVHVRFKDDAAAFDPRSNDPGERLVVAPEDRKEEGGYGLMLVMAKVDRFDYQRIGERNQNTVTMERPTAGEKG